jgi:streptogramin lyase
VREVIAQQTLRALATRRAIERQKIRKDLAAALNVRAGEPAAEAGPVQEQALGTMAAPEAPEMRVGVVVRAINALGELGVLPRTRIEKPDSVTWRKHWIFLLRRVAAPFVFGLFLGTVTVIGPLGVVEALLGGVTSGLVSVVVRYYPIGTLILTLVAMAWFWWEASDWANDEYIVTNDRIIDIERHPLAVSTERREANLGMIQNIKTKIPNLTAALLGYGDVTVQTAGTESFTFEKVAHPNDVQREIFRRMDAYREGQRQREATLRREEMGEWFSVHQELTQERTGGVACLRPGGTWDFYAPRDGLSAGEVRAIAITADGSVWFGTNNGVSRLTPRGNWERLSTLDGLVNNDIRALAVGPDGSVWFGTPQGASRLTRHRLWQSFTVAEGLASNLVTALAVGPEGSIWFGSERGASRLTPGGHWQLVSQRDGLIHDSVHAILTATDGSVWFGTSGGASRLTTEGQWETPARAPGQPASPILSMAAAPDGAVWLGSHFGASRCPAGQDQWETVSVREGLAGNVVWAVAVAPEGAVWFGTEAGASRRTPDGVWRTFTRRDGLPNDATKVIALAPDGAVWLG